MSQVQVRHPGEPAVARWQAVPCNATRGDVHLKAGMPLIDAVAAGFAATGYAAGWLDLKNCAFQHLPYLIPGVDPTGAHAAWYAGPFNQGGGGHLRQLGLSLGERDGAAFAHGHGTWEIAGDGVKAGHILPAEAVLSHDVVAQGWGIACASLVVRTDVETMFDLFTPEARTPQVGANAVLATIRPHEDLTEALEAIAAQHGLSDAHVMGLGSLISPRLDTGTVESFATEILLTKGRITTGRARLEAVIVGLDGELTTGVLQRGACPVCVTAEILLVATGPQNMSKDME